MKICYVRALCEGNLELERVLLEGNYNARADRDVPKDVMVSRLVNLSGEERVRYLGLFVDVVNRAYTRLGCLREHASDFSRKLHELQINDERITKILAGLFTAEPMQPDPALLARFSCPLRDMDRVEQELASSNHALANSCLKALKAATIHRYDNPTDPSNANTVTSAIQPVTIAALPRNIEAVTNYFESLINRGCRVFVSMHEIADNRGEPAKFWDNDVLSQVRFSDGRTIEKISEREIGRGVREVNGNEDPTLIESTLRLSDGTQITHIHYTAWRDYSACPDNALLERLHDRIEELNPDTATTVAFNCHGGVGRSGVAAATYVLRKHLMAAAESGQRLADIRVNVFDAIAFMRQFRRNAIPNPPHVPTVCNMLSRYYRRFTSPEYLFSRIVPNSALQAVV